MIPLLLLSSSLCLAAPPSSYPRVADGLECGCSLGSDCRCAACTCGIPSGAIVQKPTYTTGETGVPFRVLRSLLAPPVDATPSPVAWRTDYAGAVAASQQFDCPLLIVVERPGSPWRAEREDVQRAIRENCVALRIDGESEKELAKQLWVRKYPTIIIAAPDGTILSHEEGFAEPGGFLNRLRRAGYESARKQAERDRKPLLIRFTASWCGPCKTLAATLEEPVVRAELARFVCVVVDVDESPEIAGLWRVGSLPTLIREDQSVRLYRRMVGVQSASTLIRDLLR